MILVIIYLFISFTILRKWKILQFENVSSFHLLLAFFIKLIGAAILFYIYTDFYRERQTADIFKFYDDSLALTQVFYTSPIDFIKIILGIHEDHFIMDYFINMNHWDNSYESVITNESRIVIKICAIFNLISFNNYSVNMILFTLIGYIGILLIIKSIIDVFPSKHALYLFWSVVLFPSIFIWSAGILKEPLIFFGLGVFLFGITMILKKEDNNMKTWVLIIVGLFILLKVKFYIFCCLSPTVIMLYLSVIKQYKPMRLLFAIYFVIVLAIFALHQLPFAFDPIELLSIKQQDFTKLATFYMAGSYFETPQINGNFIDFITALPIGLFNGLLRPLPWDISKIIHVLPLIESALIIGIASFVIFRFNNKGLSLSINSKVYITSFLSFTLLLYTLIGITTPVVGALVRYKIPGTLFLILSIYILHVQKLNHEKN